MPKPSRPVIRATGLQVNPRKNSPEAGDILVARANGGMITSIDSEDIPNEAFTDLKNVRTLKDRTIRRDGHTILDLAPPDTNTITKIIYSKSLSGVNLVYRVTTAGIYRLGVASWIPVSGLPATLGEKITYATIFDTIVIADGLNHLIYLKGDSAEEIEDAPIAKYVTGFYNRVVAAHILEDDDGPIKDMWSAEFLPGDPTAIRTWDISIDESAGFEVLVDTPEDITDFITGVRGFTNYLVIPREKSIWLANKQASAAAPFRHYAQVPRGCDVPYSLQMTASGIVFADVRTQTISIFNPQGGLDELEVSVDSDIFDVLGVTVDPEDAFSAYDPHTDQYHLSFGGRNWVYDFFTKTWQYDEDGIHETASCRLFVDRALSIELSINELTGTINALTGIINDLGGTARRDETFMYVGDENGDIFFEDPTVDTDNGEEFESIFASKDLTVQPDFDVVLTKLLLLYGSTMEPIIKVEYSIDKGVSWTLMKDWFSGTEAASSVININTPINGSSVRWRIVVRTGKFELLKSKTGLTKGGYTGA